MRFKALIGPCGLGAVPVAAAAPRPVWDATAAVGGTTRFSSEFIGFLPDRC